MQPVVILDGNQRSALAATRSLGAHGVPVVVGAEADRTLAGSSRYCTASFRYPSPYEQPEAFVAAVAEASTRRGADVVFPMTDISTGHILRARDRLGPTRVAAGSLEAYETLSDKWRLSELAAELGVPAPETRLAQGADEATRAARELGFPVVVKPRATVARRSGQWGSAPVAYARSASELEQLVSSAPQFRASSFLLQRYVEGEGRGVFALYREGKPVTFFSHRRVRERPPSGGVSVLSESIPVDARLREHAQAVLDRVGWHGVAMVEFKVTRDGAPYLIEVNARFWGSLQLAIDAGVDFPYLLYRVAMGDAVVDAPQSYRVGARSRWLLGDLDHLYLTCRGRSAGSASWAATWRALVEFLKLRQQGTRYEVNRWDDLGPFLTELRRYVSRAA